MGRYKCICSDVDIEKVICAVNARAHEEQQKFEDGESRLMWSECITRPIRRTKSSVQAKIAQKKHAAQRQKKNLDGLAPRNAVGKIKPMTSVIKEPNKPEVHVPNLNITKLGTRSERYTELGQYIDRRPKRMKKKTLEQKIINHKKDLLQNHLGSKKIKR